MDEEAIRRLRREVCRSFGSSPHKKKYWLALLDMYVEAQKKGPVFCSCIEAAGTPQTGATGPGRKDDSQMEEKCG